MGHPDVEPLKAVLHPRHPRGVADAFRSSPCFDLVEPSLEGVVDALRTAPILITHSWEDAFLTPALRWVQSVSAGVDQYPLETLAGAGVRLTSARGVHGPQLAEHVFALLLSLTRTVGVAMREVTRREWRPHMGVEISGRTMAILGLGSVGEHVAARAVAWGMDVIGTKTNPADYSGVARLVLPPTHTKAVCEMADIVVCTLPHTPETRGIVGADELEALGAGWIVNVGRGSAIDEAALLEALDTGSLRGAGLDVFVVEPLPVDSPLWDHPRVVMTPHSGGLSPRYGERLLDVFLANLDAFEGDGDWINVVV